MKFSPVYAWPPLFIVLEPRFLAIFRVKYTDERIRGIRKI